jgi:hypothetical protein
MAKLFEFYGKGKKKIINPELIGPGVSRKDCVVGEKRPDGKWQGPSPIGSGMIIASTPTQLRLGQQDEDNQADNPHYNG